MSHRAKERLTTWTRAHPWRKEYWRALDEARSAHSKEWPREVFLPLEEAGQIVADACRGHHRQMPLEQVVRESCSLQCLGAWRTTQGVYRYDETLREALLSTPVTGDLPVEVLMRLPEWCVYLETPGMSLPAVGGGEARLAGVYAWLDWVSATARDPSDWTPTQSHAQIMFGFDVEDTSSAANLPTAVIPLVGGTLDDALRVQANQWRANHEAGLTSRAPVGQGEAALRYLPPILSLLLYLCAADADLGGRRPERPRPTRTKRGERFFPPDAVAQWEVGVRLGAKMRAAEDAAESEWRETTATGRARPRPHWRRAHWHGAWHGSKDPDRIAERQFRLRWQPPTAVNTKGDDLPVTVHRLKEGS